MSKTIKLTKGFDIRLAGRAEKQINESIKPDTYALKPSDFVGIIRPKVVVDEGDIVKAGTPLLFDKKLDKVIYTAPVSGEIVEIRRGERRKLLEIKILADREVAFESFPKLSSSELSALNREDAIATMLKSGVWPNIIQRPFGVVANPDDEPKAIFVSAFDTHPLSPDFDFMFKGDAAAFQAGMTVLQKLTSGTVHLNVNASQEVSPVFGQVKGVQINQFSGPHPAGNVGVQIHHLNPINKGDIAWTVHPFGVIMIGRLFLEGRYNTSKLVALAGSEVQKPKYYRTYLGASIDKMVEKNITSDNVRFISGNVLTGEKIEKNGHIGFYHHLVTVIPEGDYYELLGWLKPSGNKVSFHRALGLFSFLNPKKERVMDTNTRGEPRAFVQTGVFEKVVPMDIFPTFLLKAILAEDYDNMEALGIYEVIEEDLALCEFIDVSKHDVQAIVREGLQLIQNS